MVRALVVLALASLPRPAAAQWGVWYADSLLAQGQLQRAEAAYYAAARGDPRDPVARTALGRYLAARGATRVGAVLLEEAMRFGADSHATAGVLAPLYQRSRDYRALAALRPDVLSPAERRRAEWLSSNPADARLHDTVVVLTYRPVGDGRGIGTVVLRLGRTELPAIVDPRVSGVVLPATVRNDVRLFGDASSSVGRQEVAVVPLLRIGPVAFYNVPATIGGTDEQVRIGFDVLAPYWPAFDPARNVLTVRRAGRRVAPSAGARIPALYDTNGMRLLLAGTWQPTTAAMASMFLATRNWMWDPRRGDVVVLP